MKTLAILLALPLVAAAQIPPETLKRIKDASVYIVVDQGNGRGGSGSGFVAKADGDDLYVVTNDHVINPNHKANDAGRFPPPVKVKISVVFDSGTPTERKAVGTILAADYQRDLAVLKVSKVKNPPKPIEIENPPEFVETMPVIAFGFPFGERLAEDGKNPAISVTPGTISSLPRDANGKLTTVRMSINLNPGNSGGPIVSVPEGKLVGVEASGIPGAGIANAVPQPEVITMFKGRPGRVKVVPKDASMDEGPATLTLTLIDPLKNIKDITAHYRKTAPAKKPMGDEIMEDSKKAEMKIEDGVATAEIEAPNKGTVVVQLVMELADGGKMIVNPATIRVGAEKEPNTPAMTDDEPPEGGPKMEGGKVRARLRDGRTIELPSMPTRAAPKAAEGTTNLSDLSLKPDAYQDKTVTLEGLSNFQLRQLPKGEFEMTLLTEAGQMPQNIQIILPKDLGLQVSEVYIPDSLDINYALRVSGRVMKPASGVHQVEVSEVNFLDPEGKAVTTLKPAPVAPGGDATLSLVNRFPGNFKGKSVTLKGFLLGMDNAEKGLALRVNHESGNRVLNTKFFIGKDMSTQVANDIPSDGAAVEMTGTVEDVDPKTGQGILGITKLKVMDTDGKTEKKTLEGKDKITFPRLNAATPPPNAKPKESTKETPAVDAVAEPKSKRGAVPEAKKDDGSLGLYLGIGGGAAAVLLAGTVFLLKKKGKVEPKYGRKVVEEKPKPKPAPKPAAVKPQPTPAPKSATRAVPKPKADDNPFSNFG